MDISTIIGSWVVYGLDQSEGCLTITTTPVSAENWTYANLESAGFNIPVPDMPEFPNVVIPDVPEFEMPPVVFTTFVDKDGMAVDGTYTYCLTLGSTGWVGGEVNVGCSGEVGEDAEDPQPPVDINKKFSNMI